MPIEVKCYGCSTIFSSRRISRVLKNDKNFCSKQCMTEYGIKSAYLSTTCKKCGKDIVKLLCQTSKLSENYFCNSSCAAIYNNANKTTGYTVSKIEKYLQVELKILYPYLVFLFNDKTIIKSELDIYLPDYKLAFELNGIVHYEPIYGKEKLDQIQNNDNRKFQACLELGIELAIIDTSSIRHFKPKKAKKYLTIITDIINNKIGSK